MKKRVLLLTLLLTVIFTSSAYAVNVTINDREVIFDDVDYQKSDSIRVISDGKQIQFDVSPQIINGRTLVPMRAIFESIGLTVNWDNSTQTANGSNTENSIAFTIGSNKAIVNNQEKSLDVPASIINGRTMVPLRFLSENIGYNVIWLGNSNLILMSKKNIVEWRYEGYETVEPYKEYEVKYVNGIRTKETRYNGKNNVVKEEWLYEGYENIPPYKEYERKYVNGIKTKETRYNGANHTFQVEEQQGIRILSVYATINSVGGASPTIIWRNNSDKIIKYVYFTAVPYNAVGDAVSSSIGGNSTAQLQVTGPIETFNNETDIEYSYFVYSNSIPSVYKDSSDCYYVSHWSGITYFLTQNDYQNCFNKKSSWDPVWYNSSISSVKITSVKIDYMDGTTETISYPTIWRLKL